MWGIDLSASTDAEVDQLLTVTMPRRYAQADALRAGAPLSSIPATPSEHCYFCPYLRSSQPDTATTCAGQSRR